MGPQPPANGLPAADLRRLIDAWRADPTAPIDCPVCAGTRNGTIVVTDRSARPYAEWYHVACAACGLDQTLNIPLPGPGSFA